MKKFLILLFILVSSQVYATEKTLMWDPVNNVKEYRIDISNDYGKSWNLGISITTPPKHSTKINITSKGLVLFRVVAVSYSNKEAVNYSSGAYYNSDWELPPATTGIGIKNK